MSDVLSVLWVASSFAAWLAVLIVSAGVLFGFLEVRRTDRGR